MRESTFTLVYWGFTPSFPTKGQLVIPSRSLTWPLKNDGWKTTFLLRLYLFRGELLNFQGVMVFSPHKNGFLSVRLMIDKWGVFFSISFCYTLWGFSSQKKPSNNILRLAATSWGWPQHLWVGRLWAFSLRRAVDGATQLRGLQDEFFSPIMAVVQQSHIMSW